MTETAPANTPPARKTAPLVMDVQPPKVAPNHQLTEHGTPDPIPQTAQEVTLSQDPEVLLQQVAMEHQLSSQSSPKKPIGLIVVTVVVLVIIIAVSWFALKIEV